MCGIFGMVRNASAAHPERASAALVELGMHAITRGQDSAGLAFIPAHSPSIAQNIPNHAVRENNMVLDGGIAISKSVGKFSDMWDDQTHFPLLAASAVAIGHTRAATQGRVADLANVSPLTCGTIIGTHNGDINKDSVRRWMKKVTTTGTTDTEHLYRAINSVRSHRKKITEILEAAEGRAALAWFDRRLPQRVYLARAGLSPLAITFDVEGNLYWASGSEWFSKIDAQFDGMLGFNQVFMVPEGTLITVSFATGRPVIEDTRTFTPTVRHKDTLSHNDIFIYRGVAKVDIFRDKAASTHLVLPAPAYTPTSAIGGSKKYTPVTSFGTVASREEAEWSARNGPVITRALTLDEPEGLTEVALDDEWLAQISKEESPLADSPCVVEEHHWVDELDENLFEFLCAASDDSWYNEEGEFFTFADCDIDDNIAIYTSAAEFIERYPSKDADGVDVAILRLIEAQENERFEVVRKDWGFLSDVSAQAFINLVLNHSLYSELV